MTNQRPKTTGTKTGLRTKSSRPKKALVFISHDSDDSQLAHRFADLLAGVTGGALKSFRASGKLGKDGIPFGRSWYAALMRKLKKATSVVVLLTPRSIARPWVLYESGFAKGLAEADVFGVAIGMSSTSASLGPFSQIQNCGDDEEDLVGLIINLVRSNLHNDPPERSVRSEVREFRKQAIDILRQQRPRPRVAWEEISARIYEEMKLTARDTHKNSVARLLGEQLCREYPLTSDDSPSGYDDIAWLIFIGTLRDDLPWLYEIGLEFYQALNSGEAVNIQRARSRMLRAVRMTAKNEWLRSIVAEGNREVAGRLYHLPELVESYLSQLDPITSNGARPK